MGINQWDGTNDSNKSVLWSRMQSFRTSNRIATSRSFVRRVQPANWPNPLTGQPYKAEPPELSILSLRGPAPSSLRGIISENCNLRNIHVVTKIVV